MSHVGLGSSRPRARKRCGTSVASGPYALGATTGHSIVSKKLAKVFRSPSARACEYDAVRSARLVWLK